MLYPQLKDGYAQFKRIVMAPMLDKTELKKYFLKYLGYYYDEEIENVSFT